MLEFIGMALRNFSRKIYFIRDDYIVRKDPEYFDDYNRGDVWQPEVYELALYLAKKTKAKYVIDIGAES